MCEFCRTLKRKGQVYVYCSANPMHEGLLALRPSKREYIGYNKAKDGSGFSNLHKARRHDNVWMENASVIAPVEEE